MLYTSIAKELTPFECDCAITVALKISDDSCKMNESDRKIFMSLYRALPPYKSSMFNYGVHVLIINAVFSPSDTVLEMISKEKERAMSIITQEKMKLFKSSIRAKLSTASSLAA